MFRLFISICILLLVAHGIQGQRVIEAIPFKASGPCGISQVITHDNGSFIVVQFRGTLHAFDQAFGTDNQNDLVLFSIDHFGMLLWSLDINSSFDNSSIDLEYDQQTDRLYWSGIFWDQLNIGSAQVQTTTGSRAIFIASIAGNSGNVQWVNILMGDDQKQISATALDEFGNLYCTGYYQGTLIVNDQLLLVAEQKAYLFILKYNLDGEVIMHRNFGGNADIRPAACVTDGRSVYVSGTISGRAEFDRDTITGRLLDTDMFVIRVDDNGQNPWAILAGGVYNKNVSDMLWSRGKLWVSGYFMGPMLLRDDFTIQTNGLNIDGFVVVFDDQGYALDAVTIPGPGSIFTNDITVRNGDYIVSGSWGGGLANFSSDTLEAPSGTQYGFLLRLSATLDKLEFTPIESTGFISNLTYHLNSQGTEFVGLNFSNDVTFDGQSWLAPSTFEGLLLILDALTDIDEITSQKEQPLLFPNPVNDILYCRGCDGMTYTIIDGHGRIIESQMYQQEIDVSGLHSGTYMFHIKDSTGVYSSIIFVKY